MIVHLLDSSWRTNGFLNLQYSTTDVYYCRHLENGQGLLFYPVLSWLELDIETLNPSIHLGESNISAGVWNFNNSPRGMSWPLGAARVVIYRSALTQGTPNVLRLLGYAHALAPSHHERTTAANHKLLTHSVSDQRRTSHRSLCWLLLVCVFCGVLK